MECVGGDKHYSDGCRKDKCNQILQHGGYDDAFLWLKRCRVDDKDKKCGHYQSEDEATKEESEALPEREFAIYEFAVHNDKKFENDSASGNA